MDLRTQYAGGRPPLDDINAEILSLLQKYPFSSMRTIAESLEMPVSTIHSHLVEKIDLKLGSPYVNQRVAGEASRTLKSVTPGA
jgi:DNA-binding Lrp family transcriptional regulator